MSVYDGFDAYGHLANDTDLTLDAFDPSWISLGVAPAPNTGNGAVTQISGRVAHDESYALGGTYQDVTAPNPAMGSSIKADVAPDGLAARIAFRCAATNQTATNTACPAGHKSLYQTTSASWLGHPEAFSFAAEMEHAADYTTTVLLTPDDGVHLGAGPQDYTQEPDYLALQAGAGGTLHVLRRVAGGAVTDLTPAPAGLPYGFLANQLEDYRLTAQTNAAGSTTLTIEQYVSKGEDMSLTQVPGAGEPGATTGQPYTMDAPGQWYRLWSGDTGTTFTHAHLWFDLAWNGSQQHLPEQLNYPHGGPWTTFDQVSAVDPSAPPVVTAPTITGYRSEDSSVVISFTAPMMAAHDPNVLGYALLWTDSAGTPLDRKDTTWAGESALEANGILPSQGARHFQVFPILVGGALGPGSNVVSASAQAETSGTTSYAGMTGFLDTFNGGGETATGQLDPNTWDVQSKYLSHDSSSFVMNDHWMQTASCGDTNNGFSPHCVEMFRIRTPFDFHNRTGIVRWEVDSSSYDRNWYDLTLSPQMLNPRTISFFYNSGTQTNANLFKLMHAVSSSADQFFFEHMNGDRVEHFDGCEVTNAYCTANPSNHQPGGTNIQHKASPNFREHLALAISRTHFALYICKIQFRNGHGA